MSGRDASGPQVAVNADGYAVAVRSRFDGANYRIQVYRRPVAGGNSSVLTRSRAGVSAFGAQAAVDADGDAVGVWSLADGIIQARATGPVQNLSRTDEDAFAPQVAVRGNGNAVVVWYSDDGANYRIQARTRSAAGALGPIQTLSRAGEDAFNPQVAVDADGNAVVVWLRSDGTNFRIQARTRSAPGVLGRIKTLSGAGQNAINSQVAVDADGDAVVVWSRSDGARTRIQARTLSAGGALGRIRTLSQAGQNAGVPQVAVDAQGRAVAVWVRFDGENFRIQRADGP